MWTHANRVKRTGRVARTRRRSLLRASYLFLEQAARVLMGRPDPWTVQGTGGRLVLWISDWHSPTNLRPARSYRAVLDDALSLRDALDPSDAPAPLTEPDSPRRSIRAALERIRSEPGPNHEGSRQ